MMNAIQFLQQEHQKAKAAFEKLLKASPAQRGPLWEELRPELEAHEKIEDACLYEPLSRDAGPKDAVLADWRQRHQEEVRKVDSLIKASGSLAPEDTRWMSTIQEVHAGLEDHIREEEGDIFPRIAGVWDELRLRQAGEQMEGMKAKKTVREA